MSAPNHTKLKSTHGPSQISTDEILLDLKKLSRFGFGSGGKLHRGILSHLVWKMTGKLIEEL